MKTFFRVFLALTLTAFFAGCDPGSQMSKSGFDVGSVNAKVGEYAEFTLTADLSDLSENQRKMIPLLIEVAGIMDGIFWQEA